jgi:EAL and modified HD-GYP domain-containing signal transduction protein
VELESSSDKVYVARQPIVDCDRKTVAYELLFRSGHTGGAVIKDATQATARVLVNALNSMGVNTLVGKSKAFINCDRRMLMERTFEPLDPKVFVLEVLEDVTGDAEVAQVVGELKKAGFTIALDDFLMTPEHLAKITPFLPFASIVKIDLPLNTPAQIKATAEYFRSYPHITLLAEKVETEAEFLHCKGLGYKMFQGYFFARPEVMEGRKIDPRTSGVLQLLQVLRKDPEIKELENAFKRQPEITLNLLKYINSASVGVRGHIDSIRQTLTLIGQRKLQQWLMLMMFAGGGPNTSSASALFDNAAQRARLMENLARKIDIHGSLHEKAFLVGMLSRMDALCKVNLETILQEFDLGVDLSEALRGYKGILGDLLKIAASIELDEFEVALGLCNMHNVKPDSLQSSLTESWAWLETIKS